MDKLILECGGCSYIWYPEKKRWEKYPDADEPDCPNEDCQYYGTGSHLPKETIWLIKGTINSGVA